MAIAPALGFPTPVHPLNSTANGDAFRVAIYAPRGPRMFLGPRALLFSGDAPFTCEPSALCAAEFSSVARGCDAAAEVLATFEWGAPLGSPRIVEVFNRGGASVAKLILRASGLDALRLC